MTKPLCKSRCFWVCVGYVMACSKCTARLCTVSVQGCW